MQRCFKGSQFHSILASVAFSAVGIVTLLLVYAVERLWNLTEELNVLYKDNWTALADREMIR